MNAQNQIVHDQIDAVSAAMTQLGYLGITAVSVQLGDRSKPAIEVQYSRACERLDSALRMAVTRHNTRLQERVALLCDCQIRWQQRMF